MFKIVAISRQGLVYLLNNNNNIIIIIIIIKNECHSNIIVDRR